MSKWADLPGDVFFQIMCRLFSDDIIISSAVCKSWHSLLNSVGKLPLPPSCPWLMLAEENEQTTQECDCDCVIMVIYGEYRQLAFTRPGNKAWMDIKSSRRRRYADIAFYKGKFYAVDYDGALVVCRINDNKKPWAKAIAPPLEGITMSFKWNVQKYIVESLGGLLLDPMDEFKEECYNEANPYVTIGFIVQKLERCHQGGSKFKYKWVKVDSLGDQALFVGDNSSSPLTASSLNGIKPNCIYFTDDDLRVFNCTRNGGGSDMGVFSMEDAKIKSHYSVHLKTVNVWRLPPGMLPVLQLCQAEIEVPK
ncbi:hypothetical protein ACB092_11G237200 [Castanea dentata]